MEKKVWTKWLYWFSFAVAVIFVYKTLDNFNDIFEWVKRLIGVLMPFLMGIFLAYIFYIPSKKIEQLYKKSKVKFLRKKARTLSVFSLYVIVFLILVIVINFILPNIVQSVGDLVSSIDDYYQIAVDKINEMPEDSILKNIDMQKIQEAVSQINIEQYLNLEAIMGYAKSAIGVATGVFDVFVSIIVSVYVLIERKQILNFLKQLAGVMLNEKAYRNVGRYFTKANDIFFNFLSSQLLDAFVVAVITSIAMLILDVKYAALLGVLIGISNLIPYFGAIIGVGVAVIITMFTGGIGKAIWMAVIVIILQQIDANIINPKIVGNSLKISPLLVIFAVTIGGAYFGVLGMFLGVPVITVIKVLVEDYIKSKKEEKERNGNIRAKN